MNKILRRWFQEGKRSKSAFVQNEHQCPDLVLKIAHCFRAFKQHALRIEVSWGVLNARKPSFARYALIDFNGL